MCCNGFPFVYATRLRAGVRRIALLRMRFCHYFHLDRRRGPPGPFPQSIGWSNPGNWSSFAVPPQSEQSDVIFGPSPLPVVFQDIASGYLIHSFTFNVDFNMQGGSFRWINAGFIQQNSAYVAISNDLALNGSGFVYNGPGATDFTGILSGAGGFDKNGPGIVTFTDARYTGDTRISGGQLKLTNANSLSKSAILLNANDAINFNGLASVNLFQLKSFGSLNLGGTALAVGGGSYSGTMSATTGSLSKISSGSMSLSGAGSSLDHLSVTEGSLTLSTGSLTLTQPNSLNTALHIGSTTLASSMTINNGAVLSVAGGAAATDIHGTSSASAMLTVSGAGSRFRPAHRPTSDLVHSATSSLSRAAPLPTELPLSSAAIAAPERS
jgi:autotransporter-associated beta strand protein